jgi:uncharacterized caspase-like protein
VNDLHFGVVVGIDQYPGIDNLLYARSDAVAFHEWLTDVAGGRVPSGNVELIIAPPNARYPAPADAKPTQRQVNDALFGLKETAKQVVQTAAEWNRSRLYLYAAGHGYAPSDGLSALLLADAARNQLGYHVEIKRCVDWLVGCAPFKEIVVFSDCCRRQYDQAPPSNALPFDKSDSARSPDVFAMIGLAARRNQDALEPEAPINPDDERGVFTKALLDGLKGGAAGSTGQVTSASLAGYVRSAVETRTANAPVPQRVEFPGDVSQTIVICEVEAQPTWPVLVRFPPGAAGTAELRDDPGRPPIDACVLDGALWALDLPDGFYEVKPGPGGVGFGEKLFKVAGEETRVDVR